MRQQKLLEKIEKEHLFVGFKPKATSLLNWSNLAPIEAKRKNIRKVTIGNTLFDYEEYGKKLSKIMSRVDEGMDSNSNRPDMGDGSDKKKIGIVEKRKMNMLEKITEMRSSSSLIKSSMKDSPRKESEK